MADLGKLLDAILEVGRLVTPTLGGPGAAAALRSIDNLLENAAGIAGPADALILDELRARINAHADRVVNSLRGNEGGRSPGPHGPGTGPDD